MPPITHSVLVVDSYPDTVETTALLFRLSGIPARIARGCQEALDVACTWNPTAVVMDIPLADGDGYELLDSLCDVLGYRPLVVVITGVHRCEERSRAAGVDYHLLKPADPDALVGLLKRRAPDLQPLMA